ncbi:MAG: hypothetical protein LLG00_05900 [Planctomycetaceae bacterium]|nr:hypothetical protein [Planctomycetaceae bacterium]
MFPRRPSRLLIGLGIGLLGGVLLSGFWPSSPLYAVATDRTDTFGAATGPVDNEVEAFYVLDFLTGNLKAFVPGKQPGSWTGYFFRDVAADLGVDPQKNSKYFITTGIATPRRAGGNRLQWSTAMCYVGEVSSGKMAAYSIPWSPTMYAAGQWQSREMWLAGPAISFREGLGQAGRMGPGALPGGPRRGRGE